jgi:hypothetical protein
MRRRDFIRLLGGLGSAPHQPVAGSGNLLGHSILSLGRPAWGDQPCRRGDLVSQRGEEPNSRWWSSFDRNDGEKAPSSDA